MSDDPVPIAWLEGECGRRSVLRDKLTSGPVPANSLMFRERSNRTFINGAAHFSTEHLTSFT